MTRLSDMQDLHNPNDDGSRSAALEWARSRPKIVQEMMLKYTPASVVTISGQTGEFVIVGYAEYDAHDGHPEHVGVKVCHRTGERQIDANHIHDIEWPERFILTCVPVPEFPREELIATLGGGSA